MVLAGTFEIEVNGLAHTLAAGDSMTFRSSFPHKATNVGQEPGEVLWVISPPSF